MRGAPRALGSASPSPETGISPPETGISSPILRGRRLLNRGLRLRSRRWERGPEAVLRKRLSLIRSVDGGHLARSALRAVFSSCAVCVGERDVYFENSFRRALTLTLSHTPRTEWEREPEARPQKASSAGPKPFAYLDRGFGPFFALHFPACVVSAGGHGVYFENSFRSRA